MTPLDARQPDPRRPDLRRAQTGHGDAWQLIGRLHAPRGDTAELPGARLMTSGLPAAADNNADVTDASLVDLGRLTAWYTERHVPWGVRVPVGMAWASGTPLFHKRLMDLAGDEFVAAPGVEGLRIRRAGPDDLAGLVELDCAAFGGEPEATRPWLRPLAGSAKVTYALGEFAGEPVALGYLIRTDGRAGPAAYLAGIGGTDPARAGVTAAVTSWLLALGFAGGARFAHVHPDDDGAAAAYSGLGFREVPGFEVYVDIG